MEVLSTTIVVVDRTTTNSPILHCVILRDPTYGSPGPDPRSPGIPYTVNSWSPVTNKRVDMSLKWYIIFGDREWPHEQLFSRDMVTYILKSTKIIINCCIPFVTNVSVKNYHFVGLILNSEEIKGVREVRRSLST